MAASIIKPINQGVRARSGPVRQGMSKAVKAAGLGLVIFVTVWVVTSWQWYRSQRPVSGEEVATQLILLPAGLTVVALLAWWAASRLRSWSTRPVEAPAASASGSGSAAPAGLAGADEASASGRGVLGLACVLAEAVCLPGGEDPEQAWLALREGPLRPGLDPALQDADGLPVFTSRWPDLSTRDWLDAHAEITDPSLPESLLRAMALIEAPLQRLLAALPQAVGGAAGDPQPDLTERSGPAFLSGVGVSGAQALATRQRDRAPALDIQVWVPADWSLGQRNLFADWLRLQAGAALDWALTHGASEPCWSIEALEAPEQGWDRLLPRLHALQTEARPRLLMVLAAQSLVDETCVSGLQARGELFTSQHQGGRVPGEGAAGLLLANASMAARSEPGSSPWLGEPAGARRQRSADRSGRPGAEAFTAAMQQVLAPWLNGPEGDGSVCAWWCVSDGDHRASRTSELFEAFQTLQPDADAMQSVARLGDAWGDLGVARALAPVALAAWVVRQGWQPTEDPSPAPVPALVGLLQGSHQRWAIPVWPACAGERVLAGLTPPFDDPGERVPPEARHVAVEPLAA